MVGPCSAEERLVFTPRPASRLHLLVSRVPLLVSRVRLAGISSSAD